MTRVWVALVVVSAACTDSRSTTPWRDDAAARELVGAWDATMRVQQPYQLQLHSSDAMEICGSIALVENRAGNASTDEVSAATELGVYDLPLSRIGLEWNGIASFPTAAVSTGTIVRNGSSAAVSDSVRIVLNPGSEERIVLSGRYQANGIWGTWTAQSARGTATGSFSMQPHLNSRVEAGNCRSLSD